MIQSGHLRRSHQQASDVVLLPRADSNASPRIGEAGLDAGTVLHIALVPARKADSGAGGSTVLSARGARQLTRTHTGRAVLHAQALSLRQIKLGLRQIKDRGRRGHQQRDEQQFLHLGPGYKGSFYRPYDKFGKTQASKGVGILFN
jgi:hypothetical protein